MKIKLIITALFFINTLSAQKIYFPKKTASDSVILEKRITDIAAKILEKYKNSKSPDSLEILYKLEILAGNYKKSLATIHNYREAYADKRSACIKGVAFELYAQAKDIEKKEHIIFSKALDKAFNLIYPDLPEKYSFRIADYFEENISDKKSKFQKLLQSSKKTDSISVSFAQNLCINYLNYKTFSTIQSQIAKSLYLRDKEKFTVETFNLKTKSGGTVTITITKRKGNEQSLPVILTNNIYAGAYDNALGKRAVAYNYIGVVVNTRGKRNSNDEIEPFEHESEDLYDAIDWISKQLWCNGKIGMIGGSYLGFSQWAAVKKIHPALKTIVPQVAVGIGIDYPKSNNVFSTYMLQWISYVTNNKFTDESDFNNFTKWDSINTAWYKSGKSFRTLDSFNGKSSKIFQRWLDHPNYDEYWKKMIPYSTDFSKINIPILTTTGYYDADQLGALYYLKEHYKYKSNPNHYLVIGPYDHGGGQNYATNILYGYKIDEVARININDLAFSWFDYILKDGKKPELLKDKINFQVMDTNQWYHASTIEKTHNSNLILYFRKDAKSNKLAKEKPKAIDFTTQTIDFKNRKEEDVYFKTGIDSVRINNAVVYQTEILDKDLIISGAFTAQLKASINKKDIDITIKLIQIEPNKTVFYLSDYLGRASYAKNKEKRQLLHPNEIEIIPISNSTFVSKKIQKGSKLMVVLGINKDSNYQINYGTGKDVSEETIADAKEPLEIKWYNDSYIEIPTTEQSSENRN